MYPQLFRELKTLELQSAKMYSTNVFFYTILTDLREILN
jgi:hypothetical protein